VEIRIEQGVGKAASDTGVGITVAEISVAPMRDKHEDRIDYAANAYFRVREVATYRDVPRQKAVQLRYVRPGFPGWNVPYQESDDTPI